MSIGAKDVGSLCESWSLSEVEVSFSLVKVRPNLSAIWFTIVGFRFGVLSDVSSKVCCSLVSGYRYRGNT